MTTPSAAIKALVASRGYDLNALLEKADRQRAKARRMPPIYRDPENPSNEWAGRGHRPMWFRAAIESGKTPADLRIKDSEAAA